MDLPDVVLAVVVWVLRSRGVVVDDIDDVIDALEQFPQGRD